MTSKSTDPHDEEPTARLVGDFVARTVTGEGSTSGGRFATRLADFHRSRRRRRWALAASVVLGVVVAGLLRLRAPETRSAAPISYRVDHRDPPVGGYVLAARQAETVLEFSDGSSLRMAPRARGRVVEASGDGARFALEEGTVSAEIRPRARARWLFEAGPFLVRVHGTSFELSWAPNDTVFVLRLLNGAVSVAGPLAASELELRSGQTLTVNLRDRTSTLSIAGDPLDATPAATAMTADASTSADVSGSADVSASAAASASAEVSTTAPEPSVGTAQPSTGWSNQGWSARLAKGESVAVVGDAERLGLANVMQHADNEDLWAFANAARYAAKYALAEQALTTQRRRFPNSAHAREAAFLLGRLHDGDPAGPDEALSWYARYLSETPRGAFASDALGRKMTLLERSGRHTQAVTVAEEYVKRFPAGTYANAARVLLRAETRAP
jgi:TolA-binding protein